MDENFYAFDGHLLDRGLTPFQDFPTRSPLMIILSATILKAGGDFYALRMTAVLFSIATGVLIYLTGKLMGGQRIGATASALFFLSPYSIRYGYVFFTQPFEAFCVGLSFSIIIHWVYNTCRGAPGGGAGNPGEINGSSPGGGTLDILDILKTYRSLLIGGLILGLAVFIRRNSLAFFPAGFLILSYYQFTNARTRVPGSLNRHVIHFKHLIPQFMFSLGFFLVLVPGILLFVYVSGLSYTTYFFYSDYLQAHTGIIGNISFTLMYFDSRGFYFISAAMVFITLIAMKIPGYLSQLTGIRKSKIDIIDKSMKTFLIVGWALALYALLGNNFAQADNGMWYGFVLLFIFILTLGVTFFRETDGMVSPDPANIHTRFALAILLGILLLILSARDFFLPFDAVILLNTAAVGLLLGNGLLDRITFGKSSRSEFPSPLIAAGIFFFCILLFYLLFRVILPYYYDLLFPLCIITAFLLNEIMDSSPIEKKDLFLAGKALFVSTLILSVHVSVAEYHYGDTKLNETDIGEFNECVDYLESHAGSHEEIFTAKAMIALQADLEIIFNIVRPGPYWENDTELLDTMEYPSIAEIVDHLEAAEIRFVVVDWVMQNYFLDTYPKLNDYIGSHYHEVKECGSISIYARNQLL